MKVDKEGGVDLDETPSLTIKNKWNIAEKEPDLSTKWGSFRVMFWLYMTIIGFHVGYALAYTNQCSATLDALFGWEDKETSTKYQSMIGSFTVGGMCVGSTFGGKLIQIGRVKVLFIAALIGIVGCTMTILYFPDNLDLSLYILLAGRVLYGVSTGLIAVALPRYMDEMLPSNIISVYGGLYCFSFALATIIAYLLALGLPSDTLEDGVTKNTEELKTNQFWKVIFGLPLLAYASQIVLQLTVFPHEAPKFLLLKIEDINLKGIQISLKDNEDLEKLETQLYKVISQIYINSKTTVDRQILCDFILSNCQRDTASCGVYEALFHEHYMYGSWVALLVMFWHEAVANNSIMLYSNKMLQDMNSDDAILTPRQGTYLVGTANFIASACSVFTAKYFSRKFLFVYGHIAIGLCHISIGYFAYKQNSLMALISMMCFVFCYQNSSGCITWLYCSEIAVDVVLGFVGTMGYFVVFLLTLVTNFMMEGPLQPWGTFWTFGCVSIVAAVWMQIYVKDTSVLNDKEKKNLYVPPKYRGTTPLINPRAIDKRQQLITEMNKSSNYGTNMS